MSKPKKRRPGQPKKGHVRLTLHVSKPAREKLKRHASGRTQSSVVEELISNRL